MRRPYWFAQKNCWYYKSKSGKAIRLDPDRDTAWQLWADQTAARARVITVDTPLSDIAEEFLEEKIHLLSEARFKAVARALASFLNHFGPERSWYDFDKRSVYQWLKDQEHFQDGTKRSYGICIKMLSRWAHKEGKFGTDPLAGIRLPAAGRRESQATSGTHQKIMQHLRGSKRWNDRVYANVVAMLKLTGARPATISAIEVRDISKDGGALVIKKHKTAGKTKKPLVVYLSPCAKTLIWILREAAEKKKVDRLFRLAGEKKWDQGRKRDQRPSSQERGRSFRPAAITNFFRLIREELGIPKEIVLYSYRHSFATKSLTAGLDIATVARMLGHQSIQMVAQVYSHLDQEDLHMAAAAARVGQVEYQDGNQRAEKKSEKATDEKR